MAEHADATLLEPRRRSVRRSAALGAVLLIGALGAVAACAPPAVSASSPFYGTATQGVDGRWEGNLLACSQHGGPVTVSLSGPLDTVNPFEVEIFRGWGSDPADLIASGPIAQYTDTVVSPSIEAGTCFHVRMSKPNGQSFDFQYIVTW